MNQKGSRLNMKKLSEVYEGIKFLQEMEKKINSSELPKRALRKKSILLV